MPQYFTDDFADFPAAWTERYNAPATGAFAVTGGNLAYPNGKSGDWCVRSWDVLDADSDSDQIEVLVQLQVAASTSTATYPLVFRASGVDEAATLYCLQLTPLVGRLRWYKAVAADGPVDVGAASADKGEIVGGTTIWIRARVNGRNPNSVALQAKFWTGAFSAQPGAWDVDVSDASPIYGVGWVGAAAFGVSTANLHTLLQFGAGTNGDVAPSGTADTAAPNVTSTGTGGTNGPFAANLAENSTAAFITLTADEDVTWGALAGADAALFTKGAATATTLQIQPLAGFNFESLPHANPFVVTVTATDGASNVRTVTVNVTVTNVNEPPGAPTIGTATAGNASASVAFTPPAANGGPTPTSYTATSSPGGITGTGASSPIAVSGLTNGVEYTFSVTATNSEGTGPASAASNAVTPAAVTYSITSPAGGFASNTGSGARAPGVAFNWWAFAAKVIGDSLSGATMQSGSGTLNGEGRAVIPGLTLSGAWEVQIRFPDDTPDANGERGTARFQGTAA